MKILLIYPYCLDHRIQEDDVRVVPIGVYYIGALLREQGHGVEILNWYAMEKNPEGLREALVERQPQVIGFSILHANRWGGIEIARVAKELDPRVKIVFGGIGATFLWEHLLNRNPEIDYIVMGEGEQSFLNLVRSLEAGGDPAPATIPGIALRRGGRAVKNEPAPMVAALDRLPNPARHFTYQHLALTRGCPGKCTFCGSPAFWGSKIRFHSAGYFVDQLELLHQKGITFFYVSDDTFTLRKALVIEVCREILRRGLAIVWVAISRVNLVDAEILTWMRKAGCAQISYGVESGSQEIRALYGKRITHDQIRRAFRLTTSLGLMARAYFIYGAPGENDATIQATLDLLDEIKPLSAIFYILDLFPGTALYEAYQKRASVGDGIWDERIEDIPYYETDPTLNRKVVHAFGERLRRHYYRHLPDYAAAVELQPDTSLGPLHADFLSRLAMTFSHGDYAKNPLIDPRAGRKVARHLYRKALDYHPDQRAFLGLGIMEQQKGRHAAAVAVLTKGIDHHPGNQSLHMAMGVSLMNLGEYARARDHFRPFAQTPEAAHFMAQCRHALERSQRNTRGH